MVQRVTYRRRKSFQTKSNVIRKVRTPGGKLVVQYVGKRGKGTSCGEYGCERPLSGVRCLALCHCCAGTGCATPRPWEGVAPTAEWADGGGRQWRQSGCCNARGEGRCGRPSGAMQRRRRQFGLTRSVPPFVCADQGLQAYGARACVQAPEVRHPPVRRRQVRQVRAYQVRTSHRFSTLRRRDWLRWDLWILRRWTLTQKPPPGPRRIIRAFLIEEQKIVKKVLKAQASAKPVEK